MTTSYEASHLLERAIAIAASAHAGQVDKAGEPYILHPLRIMMAVDEPEQRIVAVLHDVVEDSALTLEDLRRAGFPPSVLSAVDALTRRAGEDYFAFIARAAHHPAARQVKIADLRDNMNVGRLRQITDRDLQRVAKYERALVILHSPEIVG